MLLQKNGDKVLLRVGHKDNLMLMVNGKNSLNENALQRKLSMKAKCLTLITAKVENLSSHIDMQTHAGHAMD